MNLFFLIAAVFLCAYVCDAAPFGREWKENAPQETLTLLEFNEYFGDNEFTAENDTQCGRDVAAMFALSYVNENVSLNMLLYSGKNNINDMGDYALCQKLDEAHHCTWNNNGQKVVLTHGFCLPTSCSASVLNGLFPSETKLEKPLKAWHCGDNADNEVDFGTILMILVLIALASFVIFGTMWDMLPEKSRLEDAPQQRLDNFMKQERKTNVLKEPLLIPGLSADNVDVVDVDNNSLQPVASESQMSMNTDFNSNYLNKPSITAHERAPRTDDQSFDENVLQFQKPPSLIMQIIMCFSLKTNAKALFYRSPTRKYQSLDGIRAFSMFWVILGHTLNFVAFAGFANPTAVYIPDGILGSLWFQFVLSAQFAVDSFFFLSGFLSSHVLFKKMEKSKKGVPVFGVIVGRYLRLFPVLAFMLGFTMTLTRFMGSGPFFYRYTEFLYPCETWWFSNLLFLNNFIPAEYTNQCLPWTWYLANDFQFFILGLILVKIFASSRVKGGIVAFILFIISVILPIWLTAANDLDPTSPESQDIIYDKPYTRIQPYLMGILMCFLFNTKKPTIDNKWIATGVMCAACGWLIWICTILRDEIRYQDWGTFETTMYNGFVHFAWALGLGTITYLCITKSGGLVDIVLSFACWDWIGKLTYCAYLLHPVVIRLYWFSQQSCWWYSDSGYFMTYFGVLIVSYGLAALGFVCIEAPFGAVLALFMKKTR